PSRFLGLVSGGEAGSFVGVAAPTSRELPGAFISQPHQQPHGGVGDRRSRVGEVLGVGLVIEELLDFIEHGVEVARRHQAFTTSSRRSQASCRLSIACSTACWAVSSALIASCIFSPRSLFWKPSDMLSKASCSSSLIDSTAALRPSSSTPLRVSIFC